MWSGLREWRSFARTLELNLRTYGAFYDTVIAVIIFTIQDQLNHHVIVVAGDGCARLLFVEDV